MIGLFARSNLTNPASHIEPKEHCLLLKDRNGGVRTLRKKIFIHTAIFQIFGRNVLGRIVLEPEMGPYVPFNMPIFTNTKHKSE